ncbi:MAG: BON domain-containing protein [Verrucomicrobiaceae bacterium]|nr:BON domain-containing protein [Verrucomicrobiaceae bacterium]
MAIALWAALMLLGWSVWAGRIEKSLEAAAREALQSHAHARFLKDVTVRFDGQEAVLTGTVHKAAMRGLAAQIVGEGLRRAPGIGAALNPVTSVRNDIAIEPLPPGWLLLAQAGEKIMLLGIAGSDDERDLVSQAVSRLLTKPGVDLRTLVEVDDERAGVSMTPDVTLSSLAAQLRSLDVDGAVFEARTGEEWRLVERSDGDALRDTLTARGVSSEQWEITVAPLLAAAWQRRDEQQKAAQEAARLARLPPPHVVLAIKGGDVLMQGDVGTSALKTMLIDAALRAYPGLRVLDMLRVSKQRRPVVDAAAMLAAFPSAANAGKAGLVAVAVPPWSWKSAPLADDDVSAVIRTTIPAGIEPRLVEADAKAVAQWFATGSDPAANPPLAPYLTLAVFADRVWLRGQVAEEATRTQVLDAVRRRYPDHLLVQFIRLNARCSPVDEALPTARSLPPAPEKEAAGVMAFAIAGEEWSTAEVNVSTFAPDGVAKAGIVPEGFSLEVAADEFSEAIDALKTHWDKLQKPPSR